MLKICLSLATSCPNFVYLHQKSEDNATQQCKKAPPPTSSHPPTLLTPHIQHSQNNKTGKNQTKPHDENKDYNECFSTTDLTDETGSASHYIAITLIVKGLHRG